MLGTIVNGIAVVIGSGLGLIAQKFLKKIDAKPLLQVIGIFVALIGLTGVLKNMLFVDQGVLESRYELEVLINLVLGTILGQLLKLDDRVTRFSEKQASRWGGSAFSEGLISASLIFCVGAMAIIGTTESVLGRHEILFLKAVIDGVTAFILTVTIGFGVIFASLSVLVYQGIIAGLCLVAYDYLTDPVFYQPFAILGYIMVICIGWNFLSEKKIKTVNMLPALLFSIISYILGRIF